jgi:hypothetical protein
MYCAESSSGGTGQYYPTRGVYAMRIFKEYIQAVLKEYLYNYSIMKPV